MQKAPAALVGERRVELAEEGVPAVHIAAIESLDAIDPNDAEGFAPARDCDGSATACRSDAEKPAVAKCRDGYQST